MKKIFKGYICKTTLEKIKNQNCDHAWIIAPIVWKDKGDPADWEKYPPVEVEVTIKTKD